MRNAPIKAILAQTMHMSCSKCSETSFVLKHVIRCCCCQWSGIVKYKNKKKTQKDAPKKSKKTKNIMLKKQNVGKNVDQRN